MQANVKTKESVTSQSGRNGHLGYLPSNAPLANPYVPFQESNPEKYTASFGMIRGTLFPGLDLPFMGLVNTTEKCSPLNELQALGFAITELGLYLDTHRDDKEALELFNQYRALYKDGLERYQKQYGPLTMLDAGNFSDYDWPDDPWPWDYQQKSEG